MIGIDTNVLVRYLTQDDEVQAAQANEVFGQLSREDPGFIGLVVLIETHWVLRRAYRLDRVVVHGIVRQLLATAELAIESRELVHRALDAAGTDYELPDALIAQSAIQAGATATLTFDAGALGLPGMTGLQ